MSDVVVLVSTYNGSKYLREQLDSILEQSYPVDVLIRDDGSSDDTISIIEEYMDNFPQVQLIKGENVGCLQSFFALLRAAKGYRYYAFSDQDDVWFKDKIEVAIKHLQALNEDKPCVYASCSLIVNEFLEGNKHTQHNCRGLSFYNVIVQNIMPGHTQVMNQKLVDMTLAYTNDFSQLFVHDFWIAMIAVTFGECYFDNEPHTYYRQHENQVIGYGHGRFSWIWERLVHVKDGVARQITHQDDYFLATFEDLLQADQVCELKRLLHSQRNVFTRIAYLWRARVYRQRHFETLLFYVLYLLGGYKIWK